MADVMKNEEYIIEISDINQEGQGIGRVNGFAVFVDGALIGEKVRTRITEVKKNYAVGKLLEIRAASPARIKPFCPVYSSCGGCSLQHMDYGAQLKFKTNMVRETLKRIGKIRNADQLVRETLGMKCPMRYRNKVQYPLGISGGKVVMGFFAKRSHNIVDIRDCGIQHDAANKVRDIFKRFIERYGISVYDEINHTGLVRHLMVRVGFKTGEIMVVVVINGNDLPKKDKLVKMLLAEVPGIKSIILNVNTRKTNVILGEENIKIYGKDSITDYIGSFRFDISPLSFFQVNPVQTEVLYNKALEFAGLTGRETVFDLYCGTGTISLFMAQKAKEVYGVEVVEEAVEDARRNARANGVDNVEFITGEAEKVVPMMYKDGIRADVVVVDPPRKGCDASVLETIARMDPDRIVYVSCNPATLARDLMYLGERGYEVKEVQPVDMFPWTGHVESVVLITRA